MAAAVTNTGNQPNSNRAIPAHSRRKHLLRRSDLREARAVITEARASGAMSVRPAIMEWLRRQS